jgi:hypothetical protein
VLHKQALFQDSPFSVSSGPTSGKAVSDSELERMLQQSALKIAFVGRGGLRHISVKNNFR